MTRAPARGSEFRFVRYDRNPWGGQIVEDYLTEKRLVVREWLELDALDALDAIAAMVDHGLDVAIVSDGAPPWPEGLRFRKTLLLADGEVRQTGVLWRNSGAHRIALGETARTRAGRTAVSHLSRGLYPWLPDFPDFGLTRRAAGILVSFMDRGSFLSPEERAHLEALVRRPTERHGIARRANAMLLLDEAALRGSGAGALRRHHPRLRTSAWSRTSASPRRPR